MKLTQFLLVPTLCFVCQPATATWSDDPAVNLPVADRTGEQTQAKQATRTDGKTYLSWFDNSTGGYDVYLQLLDSDGSELWAHNGVLIADRSFSSTQDYDLAVDTAGNALLAFRDDRSGSVNITAAAVDASGGLLWGPNGVQVANGIDFVAAPKIAATSNGAAVVAWTNEADAVLQKLDNTGNPLWGAGVTLSDNNGGSFTVSDLNASDAGGVIVSIVRQTNFSSPKHLYAQKLSTSGSTLWGSAPVVVFDGGSLQFGNFPEFISDGSGGAVFAWYDTSSGLQCFAQRILSAGTEVFAHNGVAVSTAARDRVNPVVAFDPVQSATYVYWREQLPGPNPEDGVYGQKLDGVGTRQWTDDGLVISPLTTDTRTQIRTSPYDSGMVVAWVQELAFDVDRIMATRIDSSGNTLWTPSQTTVATSSSGKSRLFLAGNPNERVTLSWSDNRNDANDIYVQNVNGGGSLGLGTSDADGDSIADDVDNCTLIANPDQRDTNGDGFGNACDADINNDCIVGFIDSAVYRNNFFQAGDLDTDNNGDNITNFIDLTLLKEQFFGPPGPSATDCTIRTGH